MGGAAAAAAFAGETGRMIALERISSYPYQCIAKSVDVQQVADHVVLRVKDTGIGIPAAEQGRIFERFYRVDKSHSKAVGGTGLGLSIVKHGAALHHATISVSSEPEQGTEITLTFPAA